MIEIFKTNVHEEAHAERMLALISKAFPFAKANFDLEDSDRILKVEGTGFSSDMIIELLANDGYHCEVLT